MTSPLTTIMNSIFYQKDDISKTEEFKKAYVPHVVNNCVANCPDTIFYAALISLYPDIPAETHYKYLLYSIRKKRRYGKWFKKSEKSDTIECIKEYYNVRTQVALMYLPHLSTENLENIKKMLNKGGT